MANGSLIREGNRDRQYLLLDAAASDATMNGVWVETIDYRNSPVVEVSGIAGGLVLSLCGSNAADKPANTTHGTELLSIDADGLYAPSKMPRWVKMRSTTAGTGTVSASILSGK